jgi:hypothetical protein
MCLLLLEDAISMALEDSTDIADGLCNTSSHETTRKGTPNPVLDRQVQLYNGKEGKDGEEGDVGSHVGDVRVPAIFFHAAGGQSAKVAIESHFCSTRIFSKG